MSDLHLESFVICDVKGKEWTWANQRGGCHCPGKGMAHPYQCAVLPGVQMGTWRPSRADVSRASAHPLSSLHCVPRPSAAVPRRPHPRRDQL